MYYLDSPVRIWRQRQRDYDLIGKVGQIVSWTEIKNRVIGLIEVDKKRVMAQIIGENIKMKQRVIGVFRKVNDFGPEGLIEYGVKFQVVK